MAREISEELQAAEDARAAAKAECDRLTEESDAMYFKSLELKERRKAARAELDQTIAAVLALGGYPLPDPAEGGGV